MDAEQELPQPNNNNHFDYAFLMESFSHIENKEALLARLLTTANGLVMRINTRELEGSGINHLS